MKTIHISGVRQMVVTDEAKPVAGAGEVLLKLQYVGFCGSD